MNLAPIQKPETYEQLLLQKFQAELQEQRAAVEERCVQVLGPPFISVWSPQYTWKVNTGRIKWIDNQLALWAEEWWRGYSYEVVRGPDGSVGIKSKEQ